jgi:TRAP-type C4-dicarboxylate transport system permease small subunit
MYNRTGKIAVKFAFRYLRRRYRRETRIAFGALGVGFVAAVAYFATRDAPEG